MTSSSPEPGMREGAPVQCRLCSGATRVLFTKRVLERHDVGYMECEACGSLQTDEPTWLDVAYAIPGVHVDVGQASRGLHTWLRVCFFLESIGFDKSRVCIDFGASIGLLARLMRDAGYDFRAYDLHDSCKLVNYFKVDSLQAAAPALITAFEVFEHFPYPGEQVSELLRAGAEVVIFSTAIYGDHGPDWDYLAAECGQHVFFYSAKGLTDIAAEYGYDFASTPDFHVFVRRDSAYRSAIFERKDRQIDPEFIARQIMDVSWGAEGIMRDHAYAVDRFAKELRHAAVAAPPKKPAAVRLPDPLGRLLARLSRAG